jgi:3-hydroxyisobutyrate dehydrogenase
MDVNERHWRLWKMMIGYIGLGALGGVLARRFLLSHKLVVWDSNPAAVSALEQLGATSAPTAADLGRQCDVVLLCLPRSSDVREVLFGTAGLAEGLSAGKLVIDQTSGIPSETHEIAEHLSVLGVEMIDAAVSASPQIVEKGGATLMASGPDEVFDRAIPILKVITETVFRCGSRVGDGQAMKMTNNAMNAGCRLGTLEVVAMGRKMGLPLESLSDVLNKGSARNLTTARMLPAILAGVPSTNFALSLMLKDLNQAVSLGMDCGVPMPISSIVRGLLQIGVNTLGKDARLEDIIGLIESMAGTKFAPQGAGDCVEPAGASSDPQALKVGYVGLGAMGGALARRLAVSHEVEVFDAQPDAVRRLVGTTVKASPDLPSIARANDIIMTCLPTSAHLRQALFGRAGLAEGLSPGKIVIDQTTGDPEETRAIAAQLDKLGVALVDAPVSGGARGATAGTIAVMVGGDPRAYGRVKNLLGLISPNVSYCGRSGNGHLAKLANNAVSSLCRLVTYECVSAGYKYGLKIEDMIQVLGKTSGWSVGGRRVLETLVSDQLAATFQLKLLLKDVTLAARMGISCGAPMLISNMARNLIEVAANTLGGVTNIDEMARMYESMSDIRFKADTRDVVKQT